MERSDPTTPKIENRSSPTVRACCNRQATVRQVPVSRFCGLVTWLAKFLRGISTVQNAMPQLDEDDRTRMYQRMRSASKPPNQSEAISHVNNANLRTAGDFQQSKAWLRLERGLGIRIVEHTWL